MNLAKWVNTAYLHEQKLSSLRTNYSQNKPFAHLRLKNFFNSTKLESVKNALLKETFVKANADLFSFQQTNDLKLTKNSTLKEFRAFLNSHEFLTFLSYLTSENLSKEIDISGFIYEDTDHLLPHDDKLEGRKIAFVIQMTKEWTPKDGGQLDLFKNNKIAKSYLPEWNAFDLFTVKPGTTMHQVREVLSNKKRITLTGWFHGSSSRVHKNRRFE